MVGGVIHLCYTLVGGVIHLCYTLVTYLLVTYVSILYRFRDIASYLSKVADFDPPHLQLAPSWG